MNVSKSLEESSVRRNILGDFEYKMVVKELRRIGIKYNPNILLRKLEREYSVIETSYWSGNQHWWRIIDKKGFEDAIAYYEKRDEKEEDVNIRLLRIQYNLIEPETILLTLKKLANKKTVSQRDRKMLTEIAFEYLDKVTLLIDKLSQYEEKFAREIRLLYEIIDLAEKLSMKISRAHRVQEEEYTERDKIKGTILECRGKINNHQT